MKQSPETQSPETQNPETQSPEALPGGKRPAGARWKLYWQLFSAFFRIGLFTFGGGYAMLPMLERETVDRYHWTTSPELLDIFALSQCTPGVIAVNTATFLGKKIGGFWGAVFATLGVVAPSLIIISAIAAVFQNFADYPVVVHAMAAVRVAVTALIFASILKMAKSSLRSAVQVVIAILSFLAVALFGWSPVVVVLAASVYGFFFTNLSKVERHE